MGIELRKNGQFQMILSGGDPIDKAILEEMAARAADNPAALTMTYSDGVATFTVKTR